jgi:hypothetical protein
VYNNRLNDLSVNGRINTEFVRLMSHKRAYFVSEAILYVSAQYDGPLEPSEHRMVLMSDLRQRVLDALVAKREASR